MAKVILYKLPSDTNGNILHFYTAADATVDTEATAITDTGAFTDGTVVTYGILYPYAQVNDEETTMLSNGGTGTVLFGAMPSDNDQVLVKSYAIGLANGNNDDIENIATSNFIRVTGPTGAFAVRGIADGADGVTMSLFNDTSQTMTVSNQNAGSIAANRIITGTGGDVAFAGNSVVTLTYSGEKLRWVLTAVSELPAGVGTGTVTSVSVTTANGVSGVVATATTTPAITVTLGAITPTTIVATGAISGTNLSGTNTGDQTIALTGDVTGTGTGTFAATIAADAVTLAKIANAAANSVLVGSGSAGTGTNYTEITLGAGMAMTGTVLSAGGKMAISGGVQAQAQSTTRYHGFTTPVSTGSATDPTDVGSTQYFYAWQAPYAGTIKNLFVVVNVAPAAGQTFTVTIMKNGAAQTLTCQVTDAGRTASDAVNTFAMVAGDVIAVRGVTSATSGEMNGSVAVEFLAS